MTCVAGILGLGSVRTRNVDSDLRQLEEEYRGHQLRVEVKREGTRWSWSYSIDDGKHSGSCAPRAKLAEADAALLRGINAARARADELR